MQSEDSDSIQTSQEIQKLATVAIKAALSQEWEESIVINKKILKLDKENTEALNRLARAYSCMQDYQQAQKLYKKVLTIDPFNLIALKNQQKASQFNGKDALSKKPVTIQTNGQNNGSTKINLSKIFLDEPGKTKIVALLNLAPPATLASLNCGDQVILNPKNHSVSVLTPEGTYLGAFPDDVAHRILGFIAGGNKYEAYVKSNTVKALSIFVRETLRSTRFSNQPTFQTKVSMFEGAVTR